MSASIPTAQNAFSQPANTLVVIQPDGTETRTTYTSDEPELEVLQAAVGGLIELVQVGFDGADRIAFINEEGKLKRLPINHRATAMWDGSRFDVLVGPIAILLPATLTLEQKVARATPRLAKARAELGDDLGGYSVTDFLADNFTSWTLAECREIAAQIAPAVHS